MVVIHQPGIGHGIMTLAVQECLGDILTDSFKLSFITVSFAGQRDTQGNDFPIRLKQSTATLYPNPRLVDFVVTSTGQRCVTKLFRLNHTALPEHLYSTGQLQLPGLCLGRRRSCLCPLLAHCLTLPLVTLSKLAHRSLKGHFIGTKDFLCAVNRVADTIRITANGGQPLTI